MIVILLELYRKLHQSDGFSVHKRTFTSTVHSSLKVVVNYFIINTSVLRARLLWLSQ